MTVVMKIGSHLRNDRQSDFYHNSSVVSDFSLEMITFILDACIQMYTVYAYKNALHLSKVRVKTLFKKFSQYYLCFIKYMQSNI